MPWIAQKLKQGSPDFILAGYGLRLHGRVFQGEMKQDPFWAIKALENPVHRQRLLSRWRYAVPYRYAGYSNTRGERKIVRLIPEHGQAVTLKFDEPIPPELLHDLGRVFGQGDSDAQERDRTVDRAAQDQAGDSPGLGDPADRQPAGGQQDPRLPGKGRRQEVGRKTATRKGKSNGRKVSRRPDR